MYKSGVGGGSDGRGIEAEVFVEIHREVKKHGGSDMKEWFVDLDTTKKMGIRYLKDYPHTRDSDVELFFMILRDYYREIPKERRSDNEERFLSDLYLLLKFAPDKGTVSRMRRRIQHDDGVFLPTPAVSKFREDWEKKFKEWSK